MFCEPWRAGCHAIQKIHKGRLVYLQHVPNPNGVAVEVVAMLSLPWYEDHLIAVVEQGCKSGDVCYLGSL